MPLSQTNCNNCFFHPISAMPLPQIHSHNFFPPFSTMALPQTNWNKFFSLLFRHGHNSIPLFFVIKERDKPNYFGQKNTERIRICVLFFISLLYFDNIIATNNKFFFPSYSNSFPHFFPLNFGNGIATNYVLFFCFCLQHFRIRILYLCLESTYFFFFVFVYITL